ncbi:MAG: F0F1 ATP synthase subunit A [Patescibacteria group bacterium]|nr:F0F1 ATP synthase subunit A [Patescibacteria group bacterium]MDD5716124.1 F0F1 ATP synthase subunit A [Patescibacteria group bacterium]
MIHIATAEEVPIVAETANTELLTGTDAEHAETSAEVSHEPTLYAEPIFTVGPFSVTNSLINSWAVVLLLVVFAFVIRKKIARIPRGIQNLFEMVVEGAMGMADSVTGDRKKTERIFPFVFAAFLFILLNNWLGLIPGIGSIGFLEQGHGESVFIPFFRGGTADLNTTLALALIAVVGSNLFGIITVGIWKHFNKFVNIKVLAEVPVKIRKQPTLAFVNPIKFFVGIIEIIGEAAKIASLSFRLFGNIFAGEVLLSSMAVIFAFVLPVPFMFLEIIVGVIQALIFSMLMLVYFTIASTAEEH